MDVNMDEGEASSMPDTAEVSEGEGIYQNADEQEDENSRSMNPDFEEDTGIEQQLAGGEKLKPDDSVMQVVQFLSSILFLFAVQLKKSLLNFPY